MDELEVAIVHSKIICAGNNTNNSLMDNKSVITERELSFFEKKYTQKIYPIPNFNTEMIPRRLKRRMSFITQMIVSCGFQCLGSFCEDKENLGIVIGTGWGELDTTQELLFSVVDDDNDVSVSPTLFHNSVHNTAAGYLGIILGAQGPTLTISQENQTFEVSLETGLLLLKSKQVDVVLIGAADTYFNFSVLPQNSTNYPEVFSSGCTFLLLQGKSKKNDICIKPLFSETISSLDKLSSYAKKITSSIKKPIDLLWLRGVSEDAINALALKSTFVVKNPKFPSYPASGGEDIFTIQSLLQTNTFPDEINIRNKEAIKKTNVQNVLYIATSTSGMYKSFLLYR